MVIDIEGLRDWLNSQKGNWRHISKYCKYPYSSLQKFSDGRVSQPRLDKLYSLMEYRRKKRKKAA